VLKRLTQWRPREGVSREAALAHWRGDHARQVGLVPGVRRYVQDHRTVGPDGAPPPYAGLGVLWFDDIEEARAALTTPHWRAVLEDASTFMDLEHVTAARAEEHPIF
jgi:uncharacterized protein (TIGR02118 family)